MKILVVAAHPDDEVIGVGGTIRKHVKSGDEVCLLIMTRVYAPEWNENEIELRKNEALQAKKILGIKKIYFGDFPTVKLNMVPTIELTKKIREVVTDVKPEIVYLPPLGDLNRDHDIVANAAMVVCRPLPGSTVKKVLCYEISSTTRACPPNNGSYFVPTVYVDITEFIDAKIEAMKAYQSEIRDFPNPRSSEGLRIFAQERGLSVGVAYAESFVLVRELI